MSTPDTSPGGGARPPRVHPRHRPWGRCQASPCPPPTPALGAVQGLPLSAPDTGLRAGGQLGLPAPPPPPYLFSASALRPPLSSRMSVRSKAALRTTTSGDLNGNWGRLDPHPGPRHSAAQSQICSETQSGDLGGLCPALPPVSAAFPGQAGCLVPVAASEPCGLESTCLLHESSASRIAKAPLRTKAISRAQCGERTVPTHMGGAHSPPQGSRPWAGKVSEALASQTLDAHSPLHSTPDGAEQTVGSRLRAPPRVSRARRQQDPQPHG
ncbi:unnamed protein product [Rangifer tarandus platyrhynchus]|uniref:Uncharacterized protein n=1 Tax=Rangifer tarandus platyrhynchus TaxID=3082113 RepID=A0AC59ZFX6_RANTA